MKNSIEFSKVVRTTPYISRNAHAIFKRYNKLVINILQSKSIINSSKVNLKGKKHGMQFVYNLNFHYNFVMSNLEII